MLYVYLNKDMNFYPEGYIHWKQRKMITNMGITYFERDNQLIEKRKARALERIADALEKMLGEETPAE